MLCQNVYYIEFQVKRIHEYKRQLLNILGIVYRYKKMKEMSASERKKKFVPRVCIFGGKAFATYVQAKRIVKFITDVGATVNHDPDIGDLLKVCLDCRISLTDLIRCSFPRSLSRYNVLLCSNFRLFLFLTTM